MFSLFSKVSFIYTLNISIFELNIFAIKRETSIKKVYSLLKGEKNVKRAKECRRWREARVNFETFRRKAIVKGLRNYLRVQRAADWGVRGRDSTG